MRRVVLVAVALLSACGLRAKTPIDGAWWSGSEVRACFTSFVFSYGDYWRTDDCTVETDGPAAPVSVKQRESGRAMVDAATVTLIPDETTCSAHYNGPVTMPWHLNERGGLVLGTTPYARYTKGSVVNPVEAVHVASVVPGCAPD